VVVTGSSEGIGERLACRLAAAGARLALVARGTDKLEAVRARIEEVGGEAHCFSADLSCEQHVARVLGEVLAAFGHVDILVSNAGRSIRRSVKYQGSERFHDFQRLMALNYFGALRLVLGVLPGMEACGRGQVVHVSSFGVPTRQPRFAGYCASKSALDAALQCAAGEVATKGVAMSTVYMPLVKTKMVESKGHSYDHVAMVTVDEACEYIEHAIVTRRAEVFDVCSRFLQLMYTFDPGFINRLNSLVYRLERERAPDDVAARARPRKATRQLKMRASNQTRLLKCLASLLTLFSGAERALFVRGGLPWAARDVVVLAVIPLVIVVHMACAAAIASARGARECGRWCGRQLGRPAGAQMPSNAAVAEADVEAAHIGESAEPRAAAERACDRPAPPPCEGARHSARGADGDAGTSLAGAEQEGEARTSSPRPDAGGRTASPSGRGASRVA